MDLAVISIILVVFGFVFMPFYSSFVMEWRIKRIAKKLKFEQFSEAIIRIMKGLKETGLIGEKDE